MITVFYEQYRHDFDRRNLTSCFKDLENLEEWIFGQMRQDYSDKGHYPAMYFPTAEIAKKAGFDGPGEIEFCPERGGPTFWIHKIESENGIIFSDGKFTAGKKHWSKKVQEWLSHCRERQYNPTFKFVEE